MGPTKTRPKAPATLSNYSDGIRAELGAVLPGANLEHAPPVRYHLGWANEEGRLLETPIEQGKRVRPALCLFACEALGGDPSQAMPAAVALELIHNFSLVHDDIQDGDKMRRHRPTLWTLWGAPRAVVVGNAIHTLAYRTALALSDRGATEAKALRASELLVEASLSMIAGQVMDLRFESTLHIGIDPYLRMIRLKTGALITTALELGAFLASDDRRRVASFARYGDHLGRMFQIQDDVLGIWGDEQATGKGGKVSGGDIYRKKKSFPVVLAFEQSRGERLKRLETVYGKETLDGADLELVLDVLTTVKAQEQAREMLDREAEMAMAALADLPLSAESRGEAQSLVNFLVSRDH